MPEQSRSVSLNVRAKLHSLVKKFTNETFFLIKSLQLKFAVYMRELVYKYILLLLVLSELLDVQTT